MSFLVLECVGNPLVKLGLRFSQHKLSMVDQWQRIEGRAFDCLSD